MRSRKVRSIRPPEAPPRSPNPPRWVSASVPACSGIGQLDGGHVVDRPGQDRVTVGLEADAGAPPGMRTVTRGSAPDDDVPGDGSDLRSRCGRSTAVAHAPVPHASVIARAPLPHPHGRRRRSPSTPAPGVTNSTLIPRSIGTPRAPGRPRPGRRLRVGHLDHQMRVAHIRPWQRSRGPAGLAQAGHDLAGTSGPVGPCPRRPGVATRPVVVGGSDRPGAPRRRCDTRCSSPSSRASGRRGLGQAADPVAAHLGPAAVGVAQVHDHVDVAVGRAGAGTVDQRRRPHAPVAVAQPGGPARRPPPARDRSPRRGRPGSRCRARGAWQ